jgi:hypothetical protein
VIIPTRIRIPSTDLVRRDADLAQALAAALGRALGDAQQHVLRPRGVYVRSTMADPTFVWSGHGVGEVGIDERSAFEGGVRAVIADAFSALGRESAGASPAALRAPAAERIDPDRYDRTLGLYKIPSFADEGALSALDVERPIQVDHSGGAANVSVFLEIVGDVIQALEERRPIESLRAPVGVLFPLPVTDCEPHGGAGPCYGLMVARFAETPIRMIIVTSFSALTQTIDPSGRLSDAPGAPASTGEYRLTWRGGPREARDIYRAFYEERLRALYLEHARSKNYDEASFAEKVPALIEEWIDAQISADSEVVGYVALEGGSDILLSLTTAEIRDPSAAATLRDVEVIALSEVERSRSSGESGEGEVTETPSVDEEEEVGAQERLPLFPPAAVEATPEVAEDVAFEGEPSIDELGEFGQLLAGLMDDIASRLRISRGRFAGQFVIDATAALQQLARETAAWPPAERAICRAAPKQEGNVGPLDVSAADSRQLDFLRHLAGTVPLITHLRAVIAAGYQSRADLIKGRRNRNAPGWLDAFFVRHVPMLAWGAGDIFAAACQVVFLQLLNASADAIAARLEAIDAYAGYFEQAILPELRHLDELLRMQALLALGWHIELLARNDVQELKRRYPDARLASASPAPKPATTSWHEAAASFTEVLQSVPPPPEAPRADAYEIVPLVDRTYRILDKDGQLWSAEQLERGILLRRGVLESADPLITQMADLPDVMQRFQRARVKDVIGAILTEMAQANEAVAARSRSNVHAGFQASRISTIRGPLWKHYTEATVRGTAYTLGGVHRLAHTAIGEAFNADPAYADGINYLFGAERGKEEILGLLEFTGIVILAIFCPPLAADLGIVLATHQLERAEERAQTYQALIDPEAVLSRAEVEAELFAARLGLALSFLPVGIELAGEVRAALRVGQAATEAGEAAASAARSGSQAAAAAGHLAEVIEKGFVTVFLKEATQAWLINEAIGVVISPLVEGVAERVQRTGPTGGLDRALGKLVALEKQRRQARRSD